MKVETMLKWYKVTNELFFTLYTLFLVVAGPILAYRAYQVGELDRVPFGIIAGVCGLLLLPRCFKDLKKAMKGPTPEKGEYVYTPDPSHEEVELSIRNLNQGPLIAEALVYGGYTIQYILKSGHKGKVLITCEDAEGVASMKYIGSEELERLYGLKKVEE